MSIASARRRGLRQGGTILVLALLWLAAADGAAAQSISIDMGAGEGASYTARLIQLMLLVTVLSLAPAILIMTTSFVRIVIVLSLVRSALGLQQAPPNTVLVSVALFLTAFVMGPTFQRAWTDGVSPMLEETVTQEEGIARATAPFRAFMAAQVEPEDLEFFDSIAERQRALGQSADSSPAVQAADGEPGLAVLICAFMISELTRAFEIGFLIFMPFIVIDIAVAAILMSMGMMMLPPATVSLPFKLIFFVLIDGWRLLAGSLVQSFIF